MGYSLDLLKQIAHGLAQQFGDSCEIVIHDAIKLQRDISNSESKRRRIRTSRKYISGFYDLW